MAFESICLYFRVLFLQILVYSKFDQKTPSRLRKQLIYYCFSHIWIVLGHFYRHAICPMKSDT